MHSHSPLLALLLELCFLSDCWQIRFSCVLVAQFCLTLCDPMDCSPPPPPQTPMSLEFSRQEYWSVLLPSSGDLPHPGIEPRSLALQAYSLPSEPCKIEFPRFSEENNKCNVFESSPNHSQPTVVRGKIVFHQTGPWCQKG